MIRKLLLLVLVAAAVLSFNCSRGTIIPIKARAWFNYLFVNMYVDIWKGSLDVTRVGSIANATITVNKTYRYGVFSNCNINSKHIIYDQVASQFKGVVRYTIYHDQDVLESKEVRSSRGWRGGNDSPDDFWHEPMFVFWMPYDDKYNTVTVEMEVIEADPTFMDNRKNVFWSIRGEWLP